MSNPHVSCFKTNSPPGSKCLKTQFSNSLNQQLLFWAHEHKWFGGKIDTQALFQYFWIALADSSAGHHTNCKWLEEPGGATGSLAHYFKGGQLQFTLKACKNCLIQLHMAYLAYLILMFGTRKKKRSQRHLYLKYEGSSSDSQANIYSLHFIPKEAAITVEARASWSP